MADTAIFHQSTDRSPARTGKFKLPPGALAALIVVAGSVGFAAAGALLGAFLMLPFGAS